MSIPMCMNSKDVAAVTNRSIVDARYLIKKFERDGLIPSDRKRNKLVDIRIVAKWYADYYNIPYKSVLYDFKEWMRERYATVGNQVVGIPDNGSIPLGSNSLHDL